ncbi:MAG: hypothetical protein WC522_08445 [Candidatus Omnitrophota bacterium]
MKKNEKTPKTKTTDSERETRVLLEDIRKQVRTVAEGHSGLAKKLESNEEKLNEISAVVQKIDTHYFKLQMDTESIKSQVGTLDIKTDRIERELGTVKNAVMDISCETNGLQVRVKKLEEKVFV